MDVLSVAYLVILLFSGWALIADKKEQRRHGLIDAYNPPGVTLLREWKRLDRQIDGSRKALLAPRPRS